MDSTRDAATSPIARVIGVVYLLYFLTAFLARYLATGIVVPGDAAATANHLLAHEGMYRAANAVDLIANALYIALTALFYRLFLGVNRSIALVAAVLSFVGCAVQISGALFQLAPFVVLKNAQLSSVFTAPQLQAAALLSVTLHAESIKIALVLFALFDVLLGYLVFKSTFLPRAIGVLLMVAGTGWFTILWPPLAAALSYVVLGLGGLAEIVLMLWLLVKGVNVPSASGNTRAMPQGTA